MSSVFWRNTTDSWWNLAQLSQLWWNMWAAAGRFFSLNLICIRGQWSQPSSTSEIKERIEINYWQVFLSPSKASICLFAQHQTLENAREDWLGMLTMPCHKWSVEIQLLPGTKIRKQTAQWKSLTTWKLFYILTYFSTTRNAHNAWSQVFHIVLRQKFGWNKKSHENLKT